MYDDRSETNYNQGLRRRRDFKGVQTVVARRLAVIEEETNNVQSSNHLEHKLAWVQMLKEDREMKNKNSN